ncbi:hypothetical protein DFP97_101288 [Paenibacillus prosopidis]|uniref:Uncharacterized protein n=1 Tax=Paenibacillus prosopidis TaxID=630520 RepID=A0A368W7I5_9BACL|nr:hypothetical protein DFP97_101288 [Paenibacillus prosopidis]
MILMIRMTILEVVLSALVAMMFSMLADLLTVAVKPNFT